MASTEAVGFQFRALTTNIGVSQTMVGYIFSDVGSKKCVSTLR